MYLCTGYCTTFANGLQPFLCRCAQTVGFWRQNKVCSCDLCSPLTLACTNARPQKRISNTRWSSCSWWCCQAGLSTVHWWRAVQVWWHLLSTPAAHSGPPAQASTRTCWPSWASQRWAWLISTARTTGSLETRCWAPLRPKTWKSSRSRRSPATADITGTGRRKGSSRE